MAEKGTQNPTTGTESDISKAQSQQQPPNQTSQQAEETGERQSPEKGEAESGFVGAEGRQDTSSELVEDEDLDEDDQDRREGE